MSAKALFVGFLVCASVAGADAPAGYKLIWNDEFNGPTLNSAVWNAETAKRDDAQQSENAVTLKNGILSVHTFTENQTHFTGFLTTRNKFEAKYGYYEARINFHPAAGEWCAF